MDVVLAIIVAIAMVAVIVVLSARARTARLQRRFGPEYERALRASGDRAQAERDLRAREARVQRFHIEELDAGARKRYMEEWRTVQTRFVDEPKTAVGDADRLVENVMRDRGMSPDDPEVVQNYRAAHAIASRSERGEVSTEELRQAMAHYRTLVTDLLGVTERQSQ
jgi:hypothetical protein